MGHQEVVEWTRTLPPQAVTSVHEIRAVVDASSITQIPLSGIPNEAEVEIREAGKQGGKLLIYGDSGGRPSLIEIHAAANLTELELRSSNEDPFSRVVIDLNGTSYRVKLSGNPVGDVTILNGMLVTGAHMHDRVALHNVDLQLENGWGVKELAIQGRIRLTGNGLTAASTNFLDSRVSFEGAAGLQLGAIDQTSPIQEILVDSDMSIRVTSLPDEMNVNLNGGKLFINPRPGSDDSTEIKKLRIGGKGAVEVYGVLSAPSFIPSGGDLELVVPSGGQVLDAEGSVVLSAGQRAVVIGNSQNPLELGGVEQAEGSEIENVKLYDLRIRDLEPLSKAERLVPWMPAKTKEARKLEDKMMMGATTERLARRRRAHFWTRMSYILAQSHTPGHVQSEIRYASARARLRALTGFNRERVLLFIYSLVGFGERIGQPLVAHVILSNVATAVIGPLEGPKCLCSIGTYFGAWWRIALSPLSFFRVVEPPKVSGFVAEFALLIVQLLGLVLLFFALLAIRRVSKAE